jgi:cyclic pyranopterin phosphate synthase
MSEEMTFLPKRDLLSLEELDRVCSAFMRKGVRKLRITVESRWFGATS